MRNILAAGSIIVGLLIHVPDGRAAKLKRIDVPTDPKARYFLQGLAKRADGRIAVTTVRQGPLGTSYTTRIVDCVAGEFAYAADGDSLEEFRASRHDPTDFGPLTSGSISFYIARAACGMQK